MYLLNEVQFNLYVSIKFFFGLSIFKSLFYHILVEIFLPCPENLLANLGERKELIQNLLLLLPTKFSEQYDTGSALGAALQAAFKLMVRFSFSFIILMSAYIWFCFLCLH